MPSTTLDDIFGSSPPPDSLESQPEVRPPNPTNEPSDLPSLRRQHVTTGYREGISTSKGSHVQSGFDAGLPLGAQLGMRAGTVLGILEGLVRGYEGGGRVVKKPQGRPHQQRDGRREDQSVRKEEGEEDAARKEKMERVRRILKDAREELMVERVFSGLGDSDLGSHGEEGKGKGTGAKEELGRKGDAVISIWEGRVGVSTWEENMDELELKEKEREKEKEKEDD